MVKSSAPPKTNFTHIEAERAFIATLFTDAGVREQVFLGAAPTVVTGAMFSSSVLGMAFAALQAMFFDEETIDLPRLTAKIEDAAGTLDKKDAEVLREVCAAVDATTDYANCIKLIYAKYVGRETQAVATEAAREVAQSVNEQEIGKVLDLAQSKLEALRKGVDADRPRRSQSAHVFFSQALDIIDERTHRSDNSVVVGIPSGLRDLDELTTGFGVGELIILGARPSIGKTAVALGCAEAACEHFQRNTEKKFSGKEAISFYSMEMPGSSLAMRALARKGRVNLQALRTGKLTDEDWPRLVEAMDFYSKFENLSFSDVVSVNASFIRADLREKRKLFGRVGMVFVDYLGLMEPEGHSPSDTTATKIASISRELKKIAGEHECPVMALAQLNRGVEQRPNKRPMLSDLRDSGGIEQDADMVIFLYRDEYYNPDTKDPGIMELIVAKQRNGPTGVVRAQYDGRYTAAYDLARF